DYVTNANSTSNIIRSDYAIYEYNYAGKYADGGFGGSPCTSATAPCDVDAERIAQLQFFVKPGVGGYNGTVDIDWISFGDEISSVIAIEQLEGIKAFPNPTAQYLNIEFELAEQLDVDVNVFNIVGAQMMHHSLGEQPFGKQYTQVNVQHLPKGVYIVQLASQGKVLGALRFLKVD
ncbi:MAG: T9SS type A sorting domain-containing protein, partial [Bacteroidota bacterium]